MVGTPAVGEEAAAERSPVVRPGTPAALALPAGALLVPATRDGTTVVMEEEEEEEVVVVVAVG